MKLKYEVSLLIHMQDTSCRQRILREAIQHSWKVYLSRSCEEVLAIADKEAVDLVILEGGNAPATGSGLCSELRRGFSCEELPVLIVMNERSLSQVVQLYATGANDYVAKPFTWHELLARIHMQLKLRLMQRKIIQSMLTKAEKEILQLYYHHRGEKRREIIKLLNEQKNHPITLKTLDNHITNILKKIDTSHIADAAVKAKRQRWI